MISPSPVFSPKGLHDWKAAFCTPRPYGILLSARRIPDFHRLETCAAGCTAKIPPAADFSAAGGISKFLSAFSCHRAGCRHNILSINKGPIPQTSQSSVTSIERMTCGSHGASLQLVFTSAISSRTSSPSVIFPKAAYCPSRCGAS